MKNLLASLNPINTKAAEIDWQVVYEHSLPKVFHYFCYKVGDPALAEELTAVTFEKAWQSRKNFRKDVGGVHAWLVGIARNVAADHFRQPSRTIPLSEIPEPSTTPAFNDDLQRKLDFQAILEILARFPERERKLVVLKYGAELTNREIARLTGLSESNVGTILHRVVTRIRTEWEQNHAR